MKTNSSIKINEDTWFYSNEKTLDFVSWVVVGKQRYASQFRVSKAKLKKYL